LLLLLDEIPENKREFKYNIYMDNLFSGAALFSFLKLRGYSAIGTIRENRIPKKYPLTNKKLFKKNIVVILKRLLKEKMDSCI
jgi:hypothetical protein